MLKRKYEKSSRLTQTNPEIEFISIIIIVINEAGGTLTFCLLPFFVN
jgi:hypothetical protein